MKRTALFLLLALIMVTFASAQGRDRMGPGWGQGPRQGQQPNVYPGPGNSRQTPQRPEARTLPPQIQMESVNVSGNLTIAQGRIALVKDGITYLTSGLNRWVGFVDGLKEGAQVTLEGVATVNPQDSRVKMLRVHKMTLNGKEYDLVNSFRNPALPVPR